MCERNLKKISASFIRERLGDCGIDFERNRILIKKAELYADKLYFLLAFCERDYTSHNPNLEVFTPHYGTRIVE